MRIFFKLNSKFTLFGGKHPAVPGYEYDMFDMYYQNMYITKDNTQTLVSVR